MKNYTIGSLKKSNPNYHFGIDNEDVTLINMLLDKFSKQPKTPSAGDTVIIEHPEKGILYERAIIEGLHLGEKSDLGRRYRY